MKKFKKFDSASSVRDVVERNTGGNLDLDHMPYIKNVKEAVKLVERQIADGQPSVWIAGDYDSDGINATAIMYWTLKKLGASPHTRLPKRFSEGYGLSEKIVEEIPAGSLIITVDNGIAAIKAVAAAKAKACTVIVTDHHLPPKDENGEMILPDADIIVDPHIESESEYSDLCGAAIALVFARTALPHMQSKALDVLASIATVTDVMPLTGYNHTLVREGLKVINTGRNLPGLNCLLEASGLLSSEYMPGHITEDDYGFSIGPMFNAPGRLKDNGASEVLSLLKSQRSTAAAANAGSIVALNAERKKKAKEAVARADEICPDSRPAVVYDGSFGEGIIGLVAGSISEKRYCPAIAFTDDHGDPTLLKGSGRSIPGISLKDVLDSIQHLIVRYGGHAGAAGLTIKKADLDAFAGAFAEACGEIPPAPEDICYDLDLGEFSPEKARRFIAEQAVYAPYGEGNPKIRVRMQYHADSDAKAIGDGSHFMIRDRDLTLMGFGMTEAYENAGKPKALDMIGYISSSWWKGKENTKFEIVHFVPLEN